MSVQRLTCRADAGVGDGVVGKVGGFIVCRFLIFSGFIVKWFGFVCVMGLLIEAWIALTHLLIGDEGVDTAVIEGE